MKTLVSLIFFLTIAISGYVQEYASPSPQPSGPEQTPAVDVTPSPAAPSESVPPEQSAAPEPSPALTPEPTPTPEPYDYSLPVAQSEAVDDAWFADAVLIGDSRTDGLRLYSGIRGVDFLCYKGLTVLQVLNDKQVVQTADGQKSVFQALEEKQYGKVYLCLGLNELGFNDDKLFTDTYRAVVDGIRQRQPDADIYLQLLIPVNTQRCTETNQPDYITNRQVVIYNDFIRAIALEKQVYLLDVGEVYADENGELFYDISFDGIHFNKAGYTRWFEYLKTHTVKEGGQ